MATTVSTASNIEALPQIHQGLADKSLLPSQHLVDTGYMSADVMLQSQQTYHVDLVGPARQDYKWQARAKEGFAAADFQLDWTAQQATCPQGHRSQSWVRLEEKGQPRVWIRFSQKDCRPCSVRSKCTLTKRRSLKLRADTHYQALQAARQREHGDDWSSLYDQRAGIEGSLSQGVRGFGMRRSRYIGLTKTHLQNVFIATAINLHRLVNWLDEVPLAKTRQAKFVKLIPKTVAIT